MANNYLSRLTHAFNSFFSDDGNTNVTYMPMGTSSSYRPDRPRYRPGSEKTIINAIYTRMAVDCAGVRIEHVKVDTDTGQYKETVKSGLNNCLNVEANLDQAARHFRTDIALTLFQEGVIGIIPVDTTLDPRITSGWDVLTMRVGTICEWFPEHVKVRAYNQKTGKQEELLLPKSLVAIVENPFYSVMNEPNSTLKRLIHKLALLDNVDEISSSGKLDIIIQLPYVIKSESRKKQAEERREAIETQLSGSTYGIAYTDGTEKITQLNRAVENNLLDQVKYLKEELYNELGLTPEIMKGTADDVAMLNYINRLIEPVLDAVVEAIARTFLTKTARTQGQTIMYFQAPFKLLPISKLADVVDVLSRNQIVTPNEIRPTLGLKPSKQPQADQLVNSNMPLKDQVTGDTVSPPDAAPPASGAVDQADVEEANLDSTMAELGI